MKTVLASAYAINPLKGSEDAMGWNFVLQIAKHQNVIAVTRENNKEQIEKFMADNPDEIYKRIEFQYFDLPYYLRFWKRGGKGAMLYFLLWQYGIVRFIKRQKLDFDVVHNVNFHNDWTPSHLWKLGKPFVWGPIGHHPVIPKMYLKNAKKKAWLKDRLTWAVKNYFWKISPALKQTVRKADHVWAMNSSVLDKLALNKEKMSISPSVATEDFCENWEYKSKETFTVLSIGRFVSLKGFDLTIDSFAAFCLKRTQEELKLINLVCIGTGPEEESLRQMAASSGFNENIQFVNWMPRKEVVKMYEEASVFLFPSHEGAGMVVPEAMSFGLPIVCLDNVGPGEFIDEQCGVKVNALSYTETVEGLANGLAGLFEDDDRYETLSNGARNQFVEHFKWDRRGEKLNYVYNQILN